MVAPCSLGHGSSESQVTEIPVVLSSLSVIADFEDATGVSPVRITVCSPCADWVAIEA